MRIAVCVSGAFATGNPQGDLVKNNNRLKSKFPTADFYYATWDSYKPEFERLFPNEACEYFSEPIMHYHPYEIPEESHVTDYYQDVIDWVERTNNLEWTSHHTKQILIHAWLLDTIKKNYDIIIRTRFDAFVSKEADFTPYLEDTFKNHTANCFATRKLELFNELNELKTNQNVWGDKLLDQLIIHNSDAINTEEVYRLHKNNKLHAAEFGWWQVISMPHGSNHRNHDGWVNHDKKVLNKFLEE